MLHAIPPTDIAETRRQKARLDDVIACCRDASMAYRAAAAIHSVHADELMKLARRRSSFAHALSAYLYDREERTTGTMFAPADRWLFKLRSALLGQSHLGDSLRTCLQAEEKATRRYTRALDIEFAEPIEQKLDAQRREIEESSARIRAIRGRL